MSLCKGAFPSRFPWRTSARKRYPPILRTTKAPRCKERHLGESLTQTVRKKVTSVFPLANLHQNLAVLCRSK